MVTRISLGFIVILSWLLVGSFIGRVISPQLPRAEAIIAGAAAIPFAAIIIGIILLFAHGIGSLILGDVEKED